MRKIKYYYNSETLRYERLTTPFRVWLLRIFGILSAFLVTSAAVIWLYNKFIPKPTDIESLRKYELMRENYRGLQKK